MHYFRLKLKNHIRLLIEPASRQHLIKKYKFSILSQAKPTHTDTLIILFYLQYSDVIDWYLLIFWSFKHTLNSLGNLISSEEKSQEK